jgi:hypothetical protein
MRAWLAVVVFAKEPTLRCAHAQHREIRAGHDLGPHRLRLLAGRRGQVHRQRGAAEDAVEEAVLPLEVAADRVRHEVVGAAVVRERAALPVEEDETLRLSHGQEAEEDLVHEGEEGRAGPDADGERRDRGGGEPGTSGEAARGVARVADRILQPAPDPGLSHVFLDLLDAAHLDGGPPAGLAFAQALLTQIRDPALQVIAQLAAEVVLEPLPPSLQEIQEPPHGPTPRPRR